ncbi:MAG: hypothetical protein ACQEXQ_28200 [Bacillota bacterium]
MKTTIISIILKLLFYRSPRITFSNIEINEYNKLFDEAINKDGLVRYTSSFPKQRFIQYIARNKNVLLHGSNNRFIQKFETRRQTLYNGEYVNAVFATKDGIWPVFYAVLDKSKLHGNIRNACLEIRKGEKFHFFSISQESKFNNPWTNGMIYFLPINTFHKASNEIVSFDEWVSKVSVIPLARIEVEVKDFYFHTKVSVHKSNEPLYKTWIMHKIRNNFASKSKRSVNSK